MDKACILSNRMRNLILLNEARQFSLRKTFERARLGITLSNASKAFSKLDLRSLESNFVGLDFDSTV